MSVPTQVEEEDDDAASAVPTTRGEARREASGNEGLEFATTDVDLLVI